MAEQTNKIASQEPAPAVRKQAFSAPSPKALDEALGALSQYGGFNFLETIVAGTQNMNPERKARKKIFLADEAKASERASLRHSIELWIELLSSSDSSSAMLDRCKERGAAVEEKLKESQSEAIKAVKNLEQAYRGVMLFYKNTEQEKVPNVTIVNASAEQIADLDNPRFIDYVAAELKQNYDKLDLRDNYSLLALPGYLGSNKVLDKWSKIADANKVMLFTDFADLDKPDDVVEMFYAADHTGGEIHKSHTIMACNWLVGRPRYAELGEEDSLHVSPSIALMGKVYNTLMSQVTAGKKYGGIDEVEGVVFPLRKSEISQLERMGLVPMVKEYGKVMAFSAKTLFNGDDLGLQTYSVVRVFDHVAKVMIDFMNRRSFENWTSASEKEQRKQIVKFLDGVKGPGRLIEKYKILRFERNDGQKDQVFFDIHLTPFFPAKSYLISLVGTKGDDSTEWESELKQVN